MWRHTESFARSVAESAGCSPALRGMVDVTGHREYAARSSSPAHPAALSAPERDARLRSTIEAGRQGRDHDGCECRKRRASGDGSGAQFTEISAPPCADRCVSNRRAVAHRPDMVEARRRVPRRCGPRLAEHPMPSMRIRRHPQWAAASVPNRAPGHDQVPGNGLPVRLRSCATYRPYSVTSREPTMPTGLAQLVNARGSPLIHTTQRWRPIGANGRGRPTARANMDGQGR